MATLLRALSAQRGGSHAAQERRRLFDGTAVDLPAAGRGGSSSGSGGLADEMGQPVRHVVRLGGEQHRRDLDVLPVSASAPQALKVDKHAGASERRAEEKDA